MINKLQPLSYDMSEYDLSILAPCNDRLATKLILDDYDWMSYSLETYFPTKSQGFLSVKVEYFGMTNCQMEVKQTFNISKENEYSIYHNYIFSTDIFEDFIKEYMTEHLKQWEDGAYAFCGEEYAIKLFNNVLENHSDYSVENEKKKQMSQIK